MMRVGIVGLLMMALVGCQADLTSMPTLNDGARADQPQHTATASLLVSDDFSSAHLSPNWTTYNGSFRTIDGQLASQKKGLNVIGRTAESFPSDQFSEMVLTTDAAYGGIGVQVFVRRTGLLRYGGLWQNNRGVAGTWGIKLDGGPGAPYLVEVPGPPPIAGDVMRLSAQGTSLTLTVNGIVIAQATDSTLSSGVPGITVAASTSAIWKIASLWRGGSL